MFRTLPNAPWGAAAIATSAAIGFISALWHYLAPRTGVTGTEGALLVVVSSLLVLGDGLLLVFLARGAVRTTLLVLAILGAVGTFTAALFLHEWLLAAMMVLAAIGALAGFGDHPLARREWRTA